MTALAATALVRERRACGTLLRPSPVFTVANTLFFRPPVGISAPQQLADVLATRISTSATVLPARNQAGLKIGNHER